MRRIVLLFLFFIFMPTVGYGWLGQSATNLKNSNATFSYDTDNEVWESNKGVSIEGTGNYISINDNDGLMQTIDDDFVLSSENGKVQVKGFIYDRQLLGYYKFNKDYEDSSGYDNDGASNGNATVTNKVLELPDGTSDYCSIADSYDHFNIYGSSGNETNANMSVTAWVRISDVADDGCICSKGDTVSSNRTWIFRYHASQGKFSCAYEGLSYIYSTTTIVVDTWYFVAMTREWDSTNSRYEVKLYVDGQLEATGTDTDHPPSSSGKPVIIGANSWGLTDSIEGYIDEVRIYSRCLEPYEIRLLYNDEPSYP